MSATSLAAITAATIPLVIDGRAYNFRPLNVAIIGQSCQRYTEAALPTLPDPRETMESLIGHDKDVVIAALRDLQRERIRVVNPDPTMVINWVLQSGERIAKMLIDCVDGDQKPTIESLALSLDRPESAEFINLWMEASGLADSDPTGPPSGGSKQAAKKPKTPRRPKAKPTSGK